MTSSILWVSISTAITPGRLPRGLIIPDSLLGQPFRSSDALVSAFKGLWEQFSIPALHGRDGSELCRAGDGTAGRRFLPFQHLQSRYLNNRAENSHRPIRRRERQMRRFKSPEQA